MKRKIFTFLLAFIITIAAAYYQRTTGPTYPKKIQYFSAGSEFKTKLPRSHISGSDCKIQLPGMNAETEVMLVYRKYPGDFEWDTTRFVNEDNVLTAVLPTQPAAGKLAYTIITRKDEANSSLSGEKPVVIRFRGDVPAGIILPHILLMFLSMFFANTAGIMAFLKQKSAIRFSVFALLTLIAGGMILGPLMQKYAFGAYWTGFPFGWDLTDNKTLLALISWIAAVILNRKKMRYGWIIFAALVTLVIFSVPHSMFGSELDYSTGAVTTGK
jgi:hypothetical protein